MPEININAKRNGFTLPELVITVAIIGILLAIAIPRFSNATQSSKDRVFEANHQMLITAVAIYEVKNKAKPSALADVLPLLGSDVRNSPPGAVYSITNGVVTSKYNLHSDSSKRTLVWSD